MLGRLSLDQIPFHEPIVMGALGFMVLAAVLAVGALTYFRKWVWLWTEWLTTVDHKKIGVMYIIVALVMLLRGFSDAIMMRLQMALASAGSGYLPQHHYDQVFTVHGVIMIFFMAMPFIIGLMNIIVPLQIGARDVAYPFLNSVSFWLFIVGVVLVNLSLGVGEFAKTGWLAYESLSGLDYSPDVGMDYWIWSLQISGIGTLLSGVNFIATILKKRAPGMTMMKMPIFTWTALCSNILILASFPILAGTIILLTLDRYLGFNIFTNDLGGNQMMYVNLIWAWGHPEVYILILPCFGIYSEVVATFCKKRLFGYTSLVWATVVITILSFIVWLHHFFTMGAGANVNAFFGITTMIISVPTGVKVFNWLFTIYKGRLQLTNPVMWMLGFLFTFTLGGMTGILLSVPGANFVLHNTEFVVAHFHNVIIGGVVFGVMAGYQYWFPKVFGFKLNEKLGNLSFAFWIIGFMLAFIPVYALGFMGMPRRVSQNINPEYHTLLSVAFVGAVLILFGILTTLVQLVVSIKQRNENRDLTGDPWDGRTLEWSMSSPPPEYNFAIVPHVDERDEFWEMKQKGQAYKRAEPYQDIHMPKNTGTGVIIGILGSIFGFAMIWYIWWLAIISGVGIIAAMIIHSFNYDTEFNIPKERVQKEDEAFLARVKEAEGKHVN